MPLEKEGQHIRIDDLSLCYVLLILFSSVLKSFEEMKKRCGQVLAARVRLEVTNGSNRQSHDLVWNQQYVGEKGLGTIQYK